jgi:hypothetical protein
MLELEHCSLPNPGHAPRDEYHTGVEVLGQAPPADVAGALGVRKEQSLADSIRIAVDQEVKSAFSFWRDRTTSPPFNDKGEWQPVTTGVTNILRNVRPLTARLQEPRLAANSNCPASNFTDQRDWYDKMLKDQKTSNLHDYRQGIALHERTKSKASVAELHARKIDGVLPQISFFQKHGRDMGFTFVSPRRSVDNVAMQASCESDLSRTSTVKNQSTTLESGSAERALMQEISRFECTHLSNLDGLDDSPATTPEPREAVLAGETRAAEASNGIVVYAPHPLPSVAHSKQPIGDQKEDPAGPGDAASATERSERQAPPSSSSPTRTAKSPGRMSMSTLPFSPLSYGSASASSPLAGMRSPRGLPRRDLPGLWDSRHPDAVDHESLPSDSQVQSPVSTIRCFEPAMADRKHQPLASSSAGDALHTHRAHMVAAGRSSPHSPVAGAGTSLCREAESFVRHVSRRDGQGIYRGGNVAAQLPFYQSFGVYASARYNTDLQHTRAALARRELLEEPKSGTGLDPDANVPVGPLSGRKRVWNFRYNMTYDESISRAFALDTSPQDGSDSLVWKACVERSHVDENTPRIWPGTVPGDRVLDGPHRNRVLPQGHTGDFRCSYVREVDGTYKHRPQSPKTMGKVQTGLDVISSKDSIRDQRYLTRGGRFYTDEPRLPASPQSPRGWNPRKRKGGAGWSTGVLAHAVPMPANVENRALVPERALPPYKPLAALLADHDHRGLDEDSIKVKWQPYNKHDRTGDTHEMALWKQYLNPPGMALFVSALIHLKTPVPAPAAPCS